MYALYTRVVCVRNNRNGCVMVDFRCGVIDLYAFFEEYEKFNVSLRPANG